MKTFRYTTVMLIALATTIAVNAQSVRRSANQEKKERVSATQATRQARTQPPEKQKNLQSVGREQKRPEVNRQRNVTTNRQVQQHPDVNRQRNVTTNRQVQQRQRVVEPERQVRQQPDVQRKASDRPVSISTRENPRSNYRSADSRVYVEPNRTANRKVNKYSTRNYYGGHYYHYVYPTTRVQIYHHHDTYRHKYRVLYRPVHVDIYWTRNMYRDYSRWYPNYHWKYSNGYRIQTISVWDARYNLGEVAMVYGRVYATWHNRETDDYLLFFGGDFPNQEFTVVLPGHVARSISWRPERYFLGEHMTVTGLITTFDGIPEIVVKHKRQIGLY